MMNPFSLHHLQRELRLMIAQFKGSQGINFVIGIAILIFAVVFFIVGLTRVVEFQDKGFSPLKRRSMIALHVLGTICISIAMALFALDVAGAHVKEIGVVLAAAFVLLMPIHIYLALIRRVHLKKHLQD